MTLSPEEKKTLSELRMNRAYEFFEDAKANLNEKRYKTSINRSYYATMNAARSLLILEGANPETHEGVVTLLSLKFVRPNLLPVEVIKGYKLLLSRRTDVDYGDFETITPEDAKDSLRISRDIIKQIDTLRKSLIKELS
jgi:uncharacterized protein (UPF0332 family)